jgi:hypothetical protein
MMKAKKRRRMVEGEDEAEEEKGKSSDPSTVQGALPRYFM